MYLLDSLVAVAAPASTASGKRVCCPRFAHLMLAVEADRWFILRAVINEAGRVLAARDGVHGVEEDVAVDDDAAVGHAEVLQVTRGDPLGGETPLPLRDPGH